MTHRARDRFNTLVLPRLDEGHQLARWLTGSPTDAEDVVQEASLRAFRAIDTFADGNARAWFLTIVRNTCYSWLKQHRPRVEISSEDLGPGDQAAVDTGGALARGPETPEAALIAKHEAGRLRQAIDDLPVLLKEILVLREYHDLSYREIAAVSGVPVGTVMSRLARARQALLTRFGAE